jgi:hypothetical protein
MVIYQSARIPPNLNLFADFTPTPLFWAIRGVPELDPDLVYRRESAASAAADSTSSGATRPVQISI